MAKLKEQKRQDILEELREEIKDRFGKEVVTVHTEPRKIIFTSTGIRDLDKALGGGVPMGRMVEVMGKQSSGKTTLSLSIAANTQRLYPDKHIVYVDSEKSLDLKWAQMLGVDISKLEHVEPKNAEESFNIIETYLKSGKVSLIILDSVPATVPTAALEGEIGDANIGLQARLMAQVLPRLLSTLSLKPYNETTILLINQKRANLQSRGGFSGFEPVKSTGGMALPFYMSTRLDVARIGTVKEDEKEVGQLVQVHVLKHKLGFGPGAKVQFEIDNRIGIDYPKQLLNIALSKELVKKSGSWYIFSEKEKVQGEIQAKQLIKEKYSELWKEELI